MRVRRRLLAFIVELAQRRHAQLRRCRRAPAHRAPRLRLAPSRALAARLRLAAAAASAPHARSLRFTAGGPTESQALILRPWPTLPDAPASIASLATGCALPPLSLRSLFRHQSQPALPADHRHDRAALSLRNDLARGLAGRVARSLDNNPPPSRTTCSAASPAFSSPPSSPATTAGSSRCSAWTAIGIMQLRRSTLRSRTFWIASAAVVAAPIIWFIYNAVVFGDWLDFARGPYSAAAIELRTASPGRRPTSSRLAQSLGLAALLCQSCRDGRSRRSMGQHLARCSHLLGTVWAVSHQPRSRLSLDTLLWLPVPFYAYSVAFGSVPIFLPVWWPHSWYNTRYGMECSLPSLSGSPSWHSLRIAVVREFNPRRVKLRRSRVSFPSFF